MKDEFDTSHLMSLKAKISLAVGALLFVGAVIWIVISLMIPAPERSTATGEISNVPTSSVTEAVAQESSEATQSAQNVPTPTQESSPPVDTNNVGNKLAECVNGATDTEAEKAVSYSRSCFYGYTYHLPELYAVRSVSEVEVRDVKVTDDQTAHITADLYAKDSDNKLASIDAYWVERVDGQFKVVGVSPTDYANNRISPTFIQEMKLTLPATS